MAETAETVEIFEVGPRDGLQNEARIIPSAQKTALVDLLSDAGFRRIEVASFVSPRWVPQMADGADVLAGIKRASAVSYAALTPNMKGFERAMAARADEIAIFASASEGFSQANVNCSISESLERFQPVARAAKDAKVKVRGYISCVTDCPFDGPIAPDAVAKVAEQLVEMGCYELSLGDTIGKATPDRVAHLLENIRKVIDLSDIAGHFHDTSGRALENVGVALEAGVRVFDAAVGGLGGCPFAPGAAGNVATEAVAEYVNRLGYAHDLDMEKVREAARFATELRAMT